MSRLGHTGLTQLLTDIKNWVLTKVPTKTSDLTNDSHQTITKSNDTTSTASPAHSGTFTCIDTVTRDSNGHVTKVNTKTITLPSDNNTDTKVTQAYSTTNNSYPVLFSATAGITSTSSRGATTAIVNNGIYANPSTGALYATKLYSNGTEVLTSHQSLANYSTLANTVKSISISGKTITVTSGSGSAYTLTTQDTVYTHPTTSGNKHIPSGGSANQYLKYSASGTAVWANLPTIPTATSQLTNDSGFLTSHQSLANYVTLNSAQTISAEKTISTGLSFSTTKTRGTAPSAKETRWFAEYKDSAGNRITGIANVLYTDLSNTTFIYAYNTTAATGGSVGEMGIGCDASGNVYTKAPTPATADNSTKIATTAFVKAQGYLTSHQSLSNYSTLANTVKSLSISGKTITVTPGSGSAYTLTTQDTVYTHPTTAGNKHIPSGGSANQYLKYSASGTAVWANLPTIPTATSQLTNDSNYITASANITGTAANVTGTVAIANGGTGATTRLNAVKALTNENVGTSTQYFLTITSSWGKAGYCSVADAKTTLGLNTTNDVTFNSVTVTNSSTAGIMLGSYRLYVG